MSTKRRIGNVASYVTLALISIIWILPFVFLLLRSFDVGNTGPSSAIFPEKFGFGNYIYLFTAGADFLKWYFNTFIIALVVCVVQTAMQFSMSYVLSRYRFKLRKFMMNFMLVLGMFPGFLTMIVLYQVLKTIGLTGANAVPGLILVYVASSGMGYYVSKGFLDTLPKSLDEAALVDGATRAQIFVRVILPLCKPILIYTVLTSFMGPWGDYVFAYTVSLGNEAGMNVAAGLNSWLAPNMINDHFAPFCAGGVVVAIPVMVLFLFLQKYYVEGVTGGAVKG
ncbi:MAG: ABC transporter permease subunit [Bacilli bacterium]|nr:ABC transporter permease subunit [Bacilli bacterium]